MDWDIPEMQRDEILRLRNELGFLKQKYLELQRDIERVRDHREAAVQRARHEERRSSLSDLVAVSDVIEQALANDPDRDTPWYAGTLAVLRQVATVLERHGVQRIQAGGEAFDPNLHEAVSVIQSASIPEGTIVEVVRAGYQFPDGSLLRPARVVVSRPED